MKTTPSFVRVIVAAVGHLAGFLFGRVSWSAPPWLAWCGRRLLAGLAPLKAYPRATALSFIVLAALGLGAWQAWTWWESHKPRTFAVNAQREVKVTAQPLAAVSPGAPDQDLKPVPLVIRFEGAPVAPLEKIGKDAADAVATAPKFHGKWTWQDGSTLVFQPAAHWPPDTAITVKLRPAALAEDLHLDRKSLTLNTPPLVAQLQDFSFYNSPDNPAIYEVVAELNTSHPFDPDVLQQRLRMEVVGGTALFGGSGDGTPVFKVTADPKSARRYFIRSRQINVPLKEDWIKLTLPAGVVSSLVGTPLAAEVTAKTRVPDKYSGLKFTGTETRIIRTDDGEPQQFLFVATNLDIDSAQVAKRIGMWWHQRDWNDEHGKLVFDELAPTATKVALTPVEGEAPISKQHTFRFIEPRTDGHLFLRIGQGVTSPGGFETNTRCEKALEVPAFPRETRLLGKGNVLALDGERKLVVESRAIEHLRITLSRVPVSQFQHLISMNRWNQFTDPDFSGYFSKDNISQRWSKVVAVPIKNDWEAIQTVINIAEAPPLTAPDKAAGGCGVFFVTVEPVEKIEQEAKKDDIYSRIEASNDGEEWSEDGDDDDSDEINDGWTRGEGTRAERLIMATDLGMLVKVGADQSRDVYVMSLGGGLPVADVEIRALAINGSILETTRTDAAGHARLKPFTDCVADRKPVAVLAAKGTDVSFLPLGERQLPSMDYSRFDIDGVLASRIKAVEAFVFTERGVYRPGDTVHAGFIVRRRDWQPVLEGLPLAITLTDSRGREVGKQTTRLPYDGLFNCDFSLQETASLGVHQIAVDVLDKDGKQLFRLGRSAVRVEEFQPDRMKVATTLTPAPPAGWLAGKATTAEVSAQSLFGEPAPDRRVTMRVELSPADFGFPQWPGYAFYLTDKSDDEGSRAGRTIDLGEAKTDAKGLASFTLPFDTLKDASFRAAILTEAFEREGGRSVRQATTCLVSPHESVIGWKADGNLGYIAKDGGRAVNLVAIGRDLKPLAIPNLRRRLVEIRQVAVLTKLDNGNYAYVSTRKERSGAEEPLVLPASDTAYQLPTDKAGDFRLELIDADNAVRCAIPFTVVGKADENATLDREAELRMQLSKEDVMPGAEIEIQLSAPYAGAGLVTLERDRVIAARWFKTATKESTIRLKIPDDAEGTYYINAAFVRATSAPEVFHSPLSYAAAPVRVLAPKKTLTYQLEAPKEIRPGTEAVFAITSSQPTRLMLYAVDEGIHQITSYKLPRPLDYFLRKQALEVRTQQWLDLLLPEYRFLKAAPAFGGDGDAALSMHLNPFKRRQEPPVVFWSGIIEAGPQRSEVKWLVPDYFNGNLRVMAVGCNATAIGIAETSTLVKAPIILQPNTPLFVTPGDEFEATLTVFNHLPEPGETALQLKLEPSAQLAVVGEATATLPLQGGTEGIARFRLRANDRLGAGELHFTASGGNETVQRTTTLSVRPASHHLTRVTTGWFRTDSAQAGVKRTLYQEFRHTEATASITPLGLARGLEAYVREYPYGCSEQITSRAMTKLVAATETDFGLSPKEAAAALDTAIHLLASRQRADGGFGYWFTDESSDFEFHSLYVLHFLTEAKLLGHAVPEELLKGALKYASRTARAEVGNLVQAELQSYAIYLLARNGTNPGPQLVNLRDTLGTRFKGQWEHRTLAAWLAASYKLLKQDREADQLLDACLKARSAAKPANPEDPWAYYRTPMMEDLGVFYLQCRHFPERAKKFGIEDLEPIMQPLREQRFNTLACSYMTLALKAYSDLARSTGVEVSILGIVANNGTPQPLAGPSGGILRTPFGPETTALRFERRQQGSGDIGAFFQVVEQGYDAGPPAGPERSGLEVAREITPVTKDQPLRAGDPVEVVLRVRNVSGKALTNLAVVDLMPAGFEVVAGELKSGANTVPGAAFTELREDRTLFFIGLAANGEWMVKYRMKAVCAGAFVVPPALAEDMYDRGIHGVSTPGKISIEVAK